MNEKETKDYEDLKKIPYDRLTETEKADFDRLHEKKEMQEQIKSGMETFFRDAPFLKAQKQIDISQKKEDELLNNPAYAMSKRLVGMKRGDREMIKAADPILVSANDDAGGYLVPAVTQARIMELLPTYGQARRYMTVLPMTGNVTYIPKEGTLPTWTWGVGENASITSSKPTFGVSTLTPNKGGAIVVISNEMLRDANINVGAYVIKKIAQAKGTGEDTQCFAGTGSPFTGVFATANTFGGETNLASTNTLTYQKVLDMLFAVDQNYLIGGSIFGSRTVTSALTGLVDNQNRPIFMPAQGGLGASLLGFPYVIVESAPASSVSDNRPMLLAGNLENSIIGDVEGMNLTLLTEATIDGTSLGQYDLSAVRVTASMAFSAGLTSAYSVLRQQNT